MRDDDEHRNGMPSKGDQHSPGLNETLYPLIQAHRHRREGDKVNVELSPYDLTRGRITWRKK